MVATHKRPSAPAPPTSRTSSTQALSRTISVKPHSKISDNSSLSSGQADLNGAPPSTRKSKPKTALVRQEKRSLVDYFFFLFLATFAAYVLYTCPSDSSHNHSVCRSLAAYRTHVLEPYVIPPIRAAFTHPSIAQPYEQYAKPVYKSYIQPVTPYFAAAQRRSLPYISAIVQFSKRASSSICDNIIVPYWTRVILPGYTLYLEPRVKKYISPLIKRTRYYNRKAEPFIRSFAHYTSISIHRAQDCLLLVYDHSQLYTTRFYTLMKPYVLCSYAQIKPLLQVSAQAVQTKGKHVALKSIAFFQATSNSFGHLRREFVDPHVLRIWEKAVEKSGPSPTDTTAHIMTSVVNQVEYSNLFDAIPSVDAHSELATAEATPQPIADIESIAVEFTVSSTILDGVSSVTAEFVASDFSTSQIVVPTQEATFDEDSVPEVGKKSEIKETEVCTDPVEHSMRTTIDIAVDKQSHDALQGVSQMESEDLDDFLREIGLDEEELPQSDPEPQPAIPSAEQEEDLEAKKAATAAKRANIVGRHVRWRSELDSLVQALEVRVKQGIEVVRSDAIRHIGRLPSDKTSPLAYGKGKEVMEKIQSNGEKLLKGLEVYVTSLTSQIVSQENREKEKEKWDKIIDKVEGKFKNAVRGVQEDVHDWYVKIRDKEVSLLQVVTSEVKALADRAQADLGMDYAWLDDVTYYDWQNYHDLMRVYERFGQTVHALQNGTHVDAPEDELVPTLDQLDREVQSMMTGFAMKMNSLVREGDRWLDSALDVFPANEAEEDDEESGEYEDVAKEPSVSILPVIPNPSSERVDPANLMIGKSAEQIEKMARQAIVDQRIEL